MGKKFYKFLDIEQRQFIILKNIKLQQFRDSTIRDVQKASD